MQKDDPLFFLNTGPYRVNTYIVPLSKTECFLVDPAGCALCGDETLIDDFLQKKALLPIAVVLTHGHFDHITGLPHIKKAFPNAPVLIHTDDLPLLQPKGIALQQKTLVQMGQAEIAPALENMLQPCDFLKDKETLLSSLPCDFLCSEEAKKNLLQWKVMHTPGHTPGSICLFCGEKNILLSGDTVFFHSYGRTDLPGGSEEDIIKSLLMLSKTLPAKTKVYPGHETMGFLLGENWGRN